MTGPVTDVQAMLDRLAPKAKEEVIEKSLNFSKDMVWVPSVGPQLTAFKCEADELFYGGEAGGGKTDLLVGLSVTQHRRSLVLRRTNKEAEKLIERFADVLKTRDGLNSQQGVWRLSGNRIIDIGGCQLEEDKQKRKGDPHDLIGFDEVSDFTESQYTFIIGWNRSADPAQRCRVVATGNPPTRPEGLWVIKRWAAWLDPRHHNPAMPGELRWYTTGEDGKEIEVDGPGPHLVGGDMVIARSRTFIRARLSDNPDLAQTNYAATLASLPEGLRAAYRDGRFDASLRDDLWQIIPTSWVREAQERWTAKPPAGIPMSAMGVDVAQGGDDETVIAIRHGGWFAPLIAVPGAKTPKGSDVAGLIFANRRSDATVILDMGGGYGGAALEHLKSNNPSFPVVAYKGAEKSLRRTSDRRMGFTNKRTEALWRFREALDPGQPGGSPIMLPDDPALVADLTAPTFSEVPDKFKAESKEEVCKRLGRSTDRGDAAVMAWFAGSKEVMDAVAGFNSAEHGEFRPAGHRAAPKVIMGHASARAAARR